MTAPPTAPGTFCGRPRGRTMSTFSIIGRIRAKAPRFGRRLVRSRKTSSSSRMPTWSTTPTTSPPCFKPILDGVADVVYGSRFLGIHRSFMLHHYVGNKVLTLTTNLLYNNMLTDMETGYKAFLAPVIKGIRIRSNRFDFEPEITAKVFKRGYRIYEVPIYYAGRDYAEGKKITWRDGFAAVWALIRFRFIN